MNEMTRIRFSNKFEIIAPERSQSMFNRSPLGISIFVYIARSYADLDLHEEVNARLKLEDKTKLAKKHRETLCDFGVRDSLDTKLTLSTMFLSMGEKYYVHYVCIRKGRISFKRYKLSKFLADKFGQRDGAYIYDMYRLSHNITFKVVDGKNIEFAYDGDRINYGTCMRNKYDFLSIYINNPDKVKLLVSEKQGQYNFKAFIWNGGDGYWYLDNMYAAEGEYRRTIGDMMDGNDVFTIDGYKIKDTLDSICLVSALSARYIEELPFMDKMKVCFYYDVDDDILYFTNKSRHFDDTHLVDKEDGTNIEYDLETVSSDYQSAKINFDYFVTEIPDMLNNPEFRLNIDTAALLSRWELVND